MSDVPPSVIDVIGIDDSGPSGLAERELRLIRDAQLVCGGRRHLALFQPDGAERFVIRGDLEALYERLGSRPAATVVLASGDPCFYGIGPSLSQRFGRAAVRIHPTPSAVSLAFARLGLSWNDATVVSVHGRPVAQVVAPALKAEKLAVLTDPEHTPACVANALLEAGMPNCFAAVCERLGGPHERISEMRLAEVPGRAFDPLNVMILLNEPLREQKGFGRADDAYASRNGQITKSEVRAVTLARLEPWRSSVCWDVGAGAGSIAIEAQDLMRRGTVYAIERDPEQAAILRENVKSHAAGAVAIIEGEAPQALEELPDPDAVFVGGSGKQLEAVLDVSCRRLRPGGRLVANFALLEHLETWHRFSQRLGWPKDLAQISVSRAESLSDGSHLVPLAPVFVTRISKPGRAK
jgi:precorrin-6B C5,15-methyltransferase / cobalt-precorrin-6B C5,C15-methyltransferase